MPFILAGIFGIAALVCAALIGLPLKDHSLVCPASFTQPMLALEFVRSGDELQILLGRDQMAENIKAVESALGRDYLFILAYTFYLIALAHAIFRLRRKRRYLLLAVLAVVIGLADIFENGAISQLMERFQAAPSQLEAVDFQRLHIWTWTKWLGLLVYFAAVMPFLRRSGRLGQILSLAAAAVCLLGLVAFFSRNWIQPYTTAIFLLFPLTVVFCFVPKNKSSDAA